MTIGPRAEDGKRHVPPYQWVIEGDIGGCFDHIDHHPRTKGCGTRLATLTMVFKLCQEAEKTWKRIKGYKLITQVINRAKFVNGEMVETADQTA